MVDLPLIIFGSLLMQNLAIIANAPDTDHFPIAGKQEEGWDVGMVDLGLWKKTNDSERITL